MNYDVHLELAYSYSPPVAGGRHLVKVVPLSLGRWQRVVASSLTFDPEPEERIDRRDFFGNAVVSLAYRDSHAMLKVSMSANVSVSRPGAMLDVTPDLATLQRELDGMLSLAPKSPHHYVADSPGVPLDAEITAYARESLAVATTVREILRDLGERIHRDFKYDTESTEVDTPTRTAFDMRRGVCQDFTHVMIAGLRGIGIPAGYVSGFLRTMPPPGKPRLAGADAMHAWVRAWCGKEAGWIGYDPTNGTFPTDDHITVAIGRDYTDVTPIAGVLRMSGRQRLSQAVDVVPVDAARKKPRPSPSA